MKDMERKSTLRRWGAFILCLAVIWGFVFVVAPWLQKIDCVASVHDDIKRSGVDATALYYTEIQEFHDAEIRIRDSRDYAPEGINSSEH